MSANEKTQQNQERLHQHALTILRAKLTGYGNQISPDHDAALSGFCELAAMTLFGAVDSRVYFALPCGMGKTTGVRAILQAIHELGLPSRVVVASSKVEELCALRATLVGKGSIPAHKIDLQHSYSCSPERAKQGLPGFASEPSGNTDAQFLLVTHANVQSGADRAWMDRCDLVLFDESLVVGESHCLPLYRDCASSAHSVFGELSMLEAYARDREPNLRLAAMAARALYDQLLASSKDLSG